MWMEPPGPLSPGVFMPLPESVPRDVPKGFQPICPVPCGHSLSPQATQLACDCPFALVGCPPFPQCHTASVTAGTQCLSLLRGRPHSPMPHPAGSCSPPPPLHRAQQSRGLLPATETVVAALAGPRHRYCPNLAAMTTFLRYPPLLLVAVHLRGGWSLSDADLKPVHVPLFLHSP